MDRAVCVGWGPRENGGWNPTSALLKLCHLSSGLELPVYPLVAGAMIIQNIVSTAHLISSFLWLLILLVSGITFYKVHS